MQVNSSEEPDGTYAFKKEWLQKRGLNISDLSVIAVKGDSMEPDIWDGDLVLLDQSHTRPSEGDVLAVRYEDDLFIKRLQIRPKQCINLISVNRDYPSIRVETGEDANNFSIIGRVVCSMREW